MQRTATILLGLALAVIVGVGTIANSGGDDALEVGGLTPLAPEGTQEEGDLSDADLFYGDEPVTPFNGEADESGEGLGSGMAVPGFEGEVDESVVEVGSGMAVPGFEGEVDEMIVETDG